MQTSESAQTSTRPDPRIVRSETAIQAVVLELLRSGREFSSLTVSEIAAQAGVTRKTFYARFGSLEQVVSRTVEDLFTEIAAGIDDEMLRIPLADNALAISVFNAYDENRMLLAPLIRQCPAGLFIEPVSTVVTRLLDRVITINHALPMKEPEQAYLVATVASTLYGVLSVWVRRGFTESAERVATFLDALLADGIQNAVLTTPK
jgi:AcrR family transcriptional regulator